jgi:hypothetical protein
LRAEGFSFSLSDLYGGLKTSKLQCLIFKDIFSSCKISQSFGLDEPEVDSDPQLEKMLDPDPH